MSAPAARPSPRPSAWRGMLFNIVFYGWTVLMVPVGVAGGLVSPAAARTVSRTWARGALCLLAAVVGLRHEVRGLENLPDGPVMFAVKHQSAWETLALNLVLRDPAFVLKQELTRIPGFGWILHRTGNIAVDRDGGSAALRAMVGEAKARARHRASAGPTIRASPRSTPRSAYRWCRWRSIPACSGHAAANGWHPARSPSNCVRRSLRGSGGGTSPPASRAISSRRRQRSSPRHARRPEPSPARHGGTHVDKFVDEKPVRQRTATGAVTSDVTTILPKDYCRSDACALTKPTALPI
ncbi:MAG: 1-acyl-sn-glycerol-3-phosphate acyltransferase [Alphaproteobacteria bacterium]